MMTLDDDDFDNVYDNYDDYNEHIYKTEHRKQTCVFINVYTKAVCYPTYHSNMETGHSV